MVVTVPLSLLGQAPPQGPPATGPGAILHSAVLHTQGGTLVNDAEARDGTAILEGDDVNTLPQSMATLTLEGSQVLVQPETILKFQGDFVALDHGSVAVETSRSFKVKVNCITTTPVANEWTQYEVTNVNGTVHVAARKDDVKVHHEGGKGKSAREGAINQDSIVKQGQERDYDVTELCGAAEPREAAHRGIDPIYLGGIGGGTAIILCVVLWCNSQGGPPQPVMSNSQP
jgi:hypothetical protein